MLRCSDGTQYPDRAFIGLIDCFKIFVCKKLSAGIDAVAHHGEIAAKPAVARLARPSMPGARG
ncbi:hypothetical protein [Chitiniphilus shinanonensis]|uniref:hypothetical protein n=1 Tax=Chitiniphilus shinanonensis TaxID=553088 RepID=UPI00333E372F